MEKIMPILREGLTRRTGDPVWDQPRFHYWGILEGVPFVEAYPLPDHLLLYVNTGWLQFEKPSSDRIPARNPHGRRQSGRGCTVTSNSRQGEDWGSSGVGRAVPVFSCSSEQLYTYWLDILRKKNSPIHGIFLDSPAWKSYTVLNICSVREQNQHLEL